MDSQFVFILIGIGFVVGMPLLEKWADKIKQRKSRSVTSVPPRRQMQSRSETLVPPRRQMQSRSRPVQQKKHTNTIKKPALATVEGERVTSDARYSPYISTSNDKKTKADAAPKVEAAPTLTNLQDAVVWSEILNNPKFKEF